MSRLFYTAISSMDCAPGSLDELHEALALDCRKVFEEGVEVPLRH